MSKAETRSENSHFLEYAIKRVAMASGADDTHASHIAHAIVFAHKQGKLNQGLGVYECIDIALNCKVLDMSAVPEVINDDDAWAVVDGKRSSGYYTLNVMADLAIEKAKQTGIAIVYGGNHNDAGSFSPYIFKAYQQNMMAFASNNSVPLAAPIGGMENLLSCPPFDAIVPSDKQPPIWSSLKFGEFYDADISEAVLQNKPMKGKWCIDPVTGELTDDAKPYGKPIEGYGRVWGYTCAGQIETPRTYALNMWNEAMTSIVNPLGVTSNNMPTIDDYDASLKGEKEVHPTVGGSYYLCINPASFGPLAKVFKKSDDYIGAIKNCKTRPGHNVRIPGEAGYNNIENNNETVDVLKNHWQPFFENIAGRYGLSEEKLRADFAAL